MSAVARSLTVLSNEELGLFERNGYVRVKEAFDPALALAMQDEIWREIEAHGIDREDPETWRTLPHSPRNAKTLPLNEELAGERFIGAISDLLGRDDWRRPAGWGGFLVTFPAPEGEVWNIPADLWHWDGSPASEGLLIFSHYSRVEPRGGGTLILSGSHRLIADFYASLSPAELALPHKAHRKRMRRFDPWLAALMGNEPDLGNPAERVAAFMEQETEVRGVPCRVVELTGEPGDAVFCNLGMLHAVATNRAEVPRFMRSKFLFLG